MPVPLPATEHLRAAVCVARHRHFTRAAEELGLSQSALSRQIQALEERLATRLFDRVGRQVRLTAAGEVLVARATPVLEDLGRLAVHLGADTGPSARVRLATCESLAIHALPPILHGRRRDRRQLPVTVQCLAPDRLPEAVLEGTADLALTDLDLPPPSLVATALWQEEVVLVLPAGHSARSRSVTSYRHEPFVLPPVSDPTRRRLDQALTGKGIELRIAAEYASHEVIKAMVRAGHGLALLPESSIRQETRTGSLAAWPLADLPLRRAVIALTDPRRPPWPAETTLLDAMRGYGR